MATTHQDVTDCTNPIPNRPTADLWQPRWLVDVGDEIMVGIALDDGCYVVLVQGATGQWRPTTHIPAQAATMLAQLTV